MLISLFPTPFGHFQFLGSAGQNPNLILTLCLRGLPKPGMVNRKRAMNDNSENDVLFITLLLVL